MKRATLLVLMAVLPLSSAWARQGYLLFEPGSWESRASVDYRLSDANYTNNGAQEALLNDGRFQIFQLDFFSRYTLSDTWAFFGGLGGAQAESVGSDATRAGGALTAGRLGVEWNPAFFDFLEVIPRFSYLLPFEQISPDQDSVITSEGVDETLFDLHLQAAFESFRIYGSLGYLMRGEGRSTLMPWSAGIEWPAPNITFGARLMGYESLSDDADVGSSAAEARRVETMTRVNAGSFKFYSMNPGVVDSEAYLMLALGPSVHLGLFGGLTLAGTNSASEFHGGASVTFRFKPEPVRRVRPVPENQLSLDPYVDQFREDTNDGVDQKLFRPARPRPQAQPVAPARPAARPSRQDQRRQQQQREAEEMRRLQQQLDDAEMTIELKVDPKRR